MMLPLLGLRDAGKMPALQAGRQTQSLKSKKPTVCGSIKEGGRNA
jgi:hypothetical protein